MPETQDDPTTGDAEGKTSPGRVSRIQRTEK